MSIKEYIPAVKYGNKVASDEMDDASVDLTTLSYGTVSFTVGAAITGTFAITSGAQITGYYATSSTGSPTMYTLDFSQSGTTVTWTTSQGSVGTVVYTAVYIKP